jgi:hypothetical protein
LVPLDVLDVAAEFLEDDVVGLMARFKDFLPDGTRTGVVIKIEGNLVPKRLLRDPQKALAFEAALTDATREEPLPKTVGGIPWFHGYLGPDTWETNSLPINIDEDSAHFNDRDGEPVAIETYVYLPSAHMAAATSAGFVALELHESVIQDEWVRRKPSWERYRG